MSILDGLDARGMLDVVSEDNGLDWDVSSMLLITCEFIDETVGSDVFRDFVERKAREEIELVTDEEAIK